MAKTDPFFIRQRVVSNGLTFAEETIDCGAFVDALGRTILQLRNISVQYMDEAAGTPISPTAANFFQLRWQLTTQSQTQLLHADDRSLISSGNLYMTNDTGTQAHGATFISETVDLNPEQWDEGYLVGVENLYLGVELSGTPITGQIVTSLVIEAISKTMTKEAAMALALSQQ